jgi:hypothetical protein
MPKAPQLGLTFVDQTIKLRSISAVDVRSVVPLVDASVGGQMMGHHYKRRPIVLLDRCLQIRQIVLVESDGISR